MDFSFSPEQDDLRREARAYLDANPSPSMDDLRRLGWVGILASDEFTFLDAAVLFEELGRALYDGPYVLNEVARQGGDETWSIEIDGYVPHLDQVDRVLTPQMEGTAAEACAAAKSQAGEAAVFACEISIQKHGGIGFTWEHVLHRYYKRALWLESALGYGREHRAEVAESLLGDRP